MLISDTLDEDVDLYDFVEDEEDLGDEIYEDLMKTDEHPERVSEALNQISPSKHVCAFHQHAQQLLQQQQKCGVDKRECCLQEIRQTEEKYSETLESVMQVGKREERFIYIRLTQHKFKYCLPSFAALSETS